MKGRTAFLPPLLFLAYMALAACSGLAGFGESPDLARLRAQAEAGDAQSQYSMGLRHTNGQGVSQDYAAGAGWFARAAGGGHAESAYMLGIAYYSGRGVAQDHSQAVEWFARAAGGGHPRALYLLGDAYANGRGVGKEPAWAARWFAKAAERGHGEAAYALGVSHAAGLGLKVDEIQAWKWLKLAESRGHKDAARVRARIEDDMKPAEIARALKLAQGWKENPGVDFADRPTVRFVQYALGELGIDAGPVDGRAGPATAAAVGAYRSKAGLPPGPSITPELVESLRAGLAAKGKRKAEPGS